MGYLNEDGLARYDGLLKNWVTFKSGTVDGIEPLLNWQKTETAGAVSFYPLPAAPIDPVVNFAFTETGPAEGTKGPDNPSTITGVTQAKMTRCGKNLIWTPWQDATTVTRDGITWTINGDGTVTASGTATADSYFNVRMSTAGNRQLLDSGLTYVLSGCPASGSNSTYLLAFVCNSATFKDFGAGTTCSVNADDSGWISCIVRSGVTVSNLVFKPQLELGSTATSFEPYEGADYTVNLGGTYYGGSVDVSTGVMTVTWEAVKLTGNETWVLDSGSTEASSVFQSNLGLPNMTMSSTQNASTRCCSHFPYSGSSSVPYRFMTWGNTTRVYFAGPATVFPDANSFKTFLATEYAAGHPVILVYLKAAPQTVQLTPTQIYSLSQPDPYVPRTNTVYSDQVSVQVGYPKSPLATSTELTNAIISLGGNI